MKGVYIKYDTSSFQTPLHQSIEVESSYSNDTGNFKNHLKKLQFRNKKKVDQSITEILIDMTLIKFKEDFSKVSEEIDNIEYDHKNKKNFTRNNSRLFKNNKRCSSNCDCYSSNRS